MKAKFLLFYFLTMALNGWTQISLKPSYNIPDQFQTESIALHLNTTFFLTGETLLFKIHCLDKNSGKLSRLSSLAYVELVGEDKKPIAQIKVRLKNGAGGGDFFFTADVPSGNYTLIAYTKWMRNFGYSNFFRCNIMVVNPQMKPSISKTVTKLKAHPELKLQANLTSGLAINFVNQEYGHREKITLQLAAGTDTSMTLSANVRLAESEVYPISPWEESSNLDTPLNELKFLPDLRGELITGTITEKKTGKPLAKDLVSLSSPSKHFGFIMSTTDSSGRYFFNASRITSEYILLKTHSHQSNEYEIQVESNFLEEYGEFVPPKLMVDTTMKQLIERRHLSAQVENAFYAVKKDSSLTTDGSTGFFATPDKVYNIDDFTRFPTMEDIFREIIPEVVVKSRNGNFSIVLLNSTSGFRFDNAPLILIDGVPVPDANLVMQFDPSLIKTISVVTRHYFYGGLETDGVISIETYDGEAKNVPVTDMVRVNYIRPQSSKIYYSPEYDGKHSLTRIPDFRTQLYWNPAININAGTSETLTFFTGDLSGKYIVEVVGITSTGERIYWRNFFAVK